MTPEKIEQAWETIIYELVCAQEHAQKDGFKNIPGALVIARDKAHALRREMQVQARMIELMAGGLEHLDVFSQSEEIRMAREQAEGELEKEN